MTGGTVIAKYGPINFSKGQMEANDLVLQNQGGNNRTHVARKPGGDISFEYRNAGGALACNGSPVAATNPPSASP